MTLSERIHLAQELHDGIAQDLVGVGYSLDLLLSAPDTPSQTRIDLRTLRFTVNELLEKVRSEIHQLHAYSGGSLSQQVESNAKEICEGMELACDIADLPIDVSADFSYEILQIVREILRNVSSHSQAQRVQLHLGFTDGVLHLEISDDGNGGAAESEGHFGIVGAKTRASNLNGEWTIESDKTGTRVGVRIPFNYESTH